MVKGSASKIERVRRCKHAFYFSDILDLTRKIKAIAPSRGKIIHSCLQEHYNGRDWTKPIVEMKIDYDKLFDEEREEWGELPKETYRIMRGYLIAYKTIDSRLNTLATEIEFAINIEKHIYMGFIDWIYEDDRGVWICDHKTVKNLPSEQELYMDMQTLMYYEACRIDPKLKAIIGNKKLAGVVFNHIRTRAPKEPQILKSGGVSKAVCDTDIATYFEVVKKNGLDINDYKDMIDKLKNNIFFRRTKIPVSENTLTIIKREIIASLNEIDSLIKEAQTTNPIFPRTLLKGRCTWDCEFATLCFAELAGMNIEGIIEEQYEQRDKRESMSNDIIE